MGSALLVFRKKERRVRINRAAYCVLAALVLILLSGCRGSEDADSGGHRIKLKVVASLFPMYDFAWTIGGGYAEVSLLMPPGVEPHSFEPTPADVARLNSADIFIFTNRYMEPWVEDILKSTDSSRLLIVDASSGLDLLMQGGAGSGQEETKKHGHEDGQAPDPHIWLDFGNAIKMINTIRDAFIRKDPAHKDTYEKNAEVYRTKLEMLDDRYWEKLSRCRKKVMVDGGHYTFGYLARRYGLRYLAAYGLSPDAEPTAKDLARISKVLRQEGVTYIFQEELLSPRIAETISRETGASLLTLRGAHNISREELHAGTTFIDLMEKNLDQLVRGLQCR